MTPLTKEQAEALADRIEARAEGVSVHADAAYQVGQMIVMAQHLQRAEVLFDLATEIRDGTFIEVQHD